MGASSFKGIGTAYIGECDYHDDGSYVTTKWFILPHPVHACRVLAADADPARPALPPGQKRRGPEQAPSRNLGARSPICFG